MSHGHYHQGNKRDVTLKREPIEENLEDFVVSSGSGGKSPATKEQWEAPSRS